MNDITVKIISDEEISALCKAALDGVLYSAHSYEALVLQYLKNRLAELNDNSIYSMYSEMTEVTWYGDEALNRRRTANGWWEFYKSLSEERKKRETNINTKYGHMVKMISGTETDKNSDN